jgi:hypothetical protein
MPIQGGSVAKSRIKRLFSATKTESTLLVLFIPSVDRRGNEIDQQEWVNWTLEVLGRLLGGATAFPRARGVWRDDAQGGVLVFDEPVVIQCYTRAAAIEEHATSGSCGTRN